MDSGPLSTSTAPCARFFLRQVAASVLLLALAGGGLPGPAGASGLTGDDEDIFEFQRTFGNSTSGTLTLRLDLGDLGIASGEDVGSVEIFE